MTPPVTHLSMRAWAVTAFGCWTSWLPENTRVCDGQYLDDASGLIAVGPGFRCDDELPTCPECAVIADASFAIPT